MTALMSKFKHILYFNIKTLILINKYNLLMEDRIERDMTTTLFLSVRMC